MNDVYQQFLDKAVSLHQQGKLDEAEVIYNRILNRKNFEEVLLFLLSDLYIRKGYSGLAINLLSGLLMNNPDHAQAYCNLGVAYRKENFYDLAKGAWLKAIEKGGETAEVCSNLASLYADHAQPEKALEWCEKALKLDPDSTETKWHKALALLTLGNWEKGWKHYEVRQQLESWESRKTITVPLWDFKKTNHLYIHGEQGVGDEIMFASVIPDVLKLAEKITVEVNPAVAGIIRQTWPQLHVVTEETLGDYTAKIPIGSLASRFRTISFPGEPYLTPNPERVKFYREELEKLGSPPYIALAWFGGSKATRVEERSAAIADLQPIRDKYTCVSAQYTHTNEILEPQRIEAGLPKINDECVGLDLAEQAALFKAVDAVVTVQQTASHVGGAVGAKTYVMVSAFPDWRHGVNTDSMPWYKSVKLFRRKPEETWEPTVKRILEALDADFRKLSDAESKVA